MFVCTCSCVNVCVFGVCACVSQNTQHKEMYDSASRGLCAALQSRCALSEWGHDVLRVMSMGVCRVCVLGEAVCVCNLGDGMGLMCVCSYLHLGEDVCTYVCDSLSVCAIRKRKQVAVYASWYTQGEGECACVHVHSMYAHGKNTANAWSSDVTCLPV